MLNQLLFIALPYAALAVFLIGSIYRYTQKGYKVSSLSSQFLEGRTLFFGSQPFHWGMIFLFFGHLIGFLIPRSVIAWNGDPIRLIILESAALGFAFCTLWGLSVLIYRRLTNKRVQIVTNKMDVVVYIVLLTQVVSGIAVALGSRYGSNWFAAFLSPYLKSIFVFDPQIEGISTVNSIWLKVHVVSAFSIIGIIPFTRFVHFLVFPLDYLWRNYQLVIWNWNRREIRSSRNQSVGEKSKNN